MFNDIKIIFKLSIIQLFDNNWIIKQSNDQIIFEMAVFSILLFVSILLFSCELCFSIERTI